MREYEKVREVIDDAIGSCIEYDAIYDNILSIDICTAIRMILSIPEIVILADDQNLPDNPYMPNFEPDAEMVAIRNAAYNNAQNDILRANFRRVIRKEVPHMGGES